jgi:predicted DNA-binding transcriptional regulator YafY
MAPQLPDRLHRLLALLRSRSLLAAQEYVDVTGVSPRTGLRDLNQLVELGLAERIGTRRGARYRVVARSSGEKSATPDI